MTTCAPGTIAVIFVAQRSVGDDATYRGAAEEMDALAATQPGYIGIDSVRGADGLGITVSYWTDDDAAIAGATIRGTPPFAIKVAEFGTPIMTCT